MLAEGVEIGKDHSGAHWAPKSLPEVVPLNSNYGPSVSLNFTSLFSRFYSAYSNGLVQFFAIPSASSYLDSAIYMGYRAAGKQQRQSKWRHFI